MSKLAFQQVQRILCLGAHSDDIEIGCGGTILRLLSESPVEVRWVVFSGDAVRRLEAQRSADEFLHNAKSSKILLSDFRDGYFPSQWADIKSSMADVARDFNPDLVFTHFLFDRHQDHKTIAELTWNHFRNQTILEYEIPKYEGDLQTPNFYVELSEAKCQKKIQLLENNFTSQHDKPWYSPDTFWALLRLRGLESGLPSSFAEGFHSRKLGM